MGAQFRLLGDVEMWVDEALIDIGHARQRCVLAALLVDANRTVAVDSLVERVWADRPPQRARGALSGYLSRLRQVCASVDGVGLLRRSGGYLLTVDPMAVDLHRFRHLVAQARAADEATVAETQLTRALGLWRGVAFAGLDTPWLETVRDALDAERRAVEMDRIDLVLGRGGHAEVLADLAAGAAANPLDERLAGALMLALYRGGRQAEALRHYEQVRRSLAEELGVDPSPPLQTLHRRMLTADASASAQTPVPARSLPTHSFAGQVPRQLPTPTRSFAGRVGELAELDSVLEKVGGHPVATPIVTVVGTAGIGKTALALHWAHTVAGQFSDGQIFVNLRGFDPDGAAMTPAEAVRGFLDALDVPAARIPASVDAQIGLYRSLVAGRRMLILLDNAHDVRQVRPLLPGSPGCLVLVTSRNQLPGLVAGEGAHPLSLDLLPPGDAWDLLINHLGAARVEAEPDAARDIIARCARLPLALAVVAARAATNPRFALADLAGELGEARDGLDALATDPDTDVRAVLSWSYSALDDGSARVFRLLGLHPGPDLAAPAAASLLGCPPEAVTPRLAELAQVNMVDEHVPRRFRLHDLLRAYATELTHRQDTDAARRDARHRTIEHYLHSAHAAAMRLEPGRDPVPLAARPAGVALVAPADADAARAWFTGEYPVLLGVVEQAGREGLDRHTWHLAWALTDLFNRTGRWSDQTHVFSAAVRAARRSSDQPAQGYAQRILARALARLGRYDEAHAELRSALVVFDELADPAGQAHTHLGMSWVYERQGDNDAARRHDRHALDKFRVAGHRLGQARALNNISWRQAQVGDHGPALDHARQALALCRELGARYDEANTLDSIGFVHHRLGEHRLAADYYRQAITVFREVGHADGEATTLTNLGDTHHAAGDTEGARAAWSDALVILRRLNHAAVDSVQARFDSPDQGIA